MKPLLDLGRIRFAVLVIVALGIYCPAQSLGQGTEWPDIKTPGMDLGDFPNSAFTLPAGTSMIELAPFSISGTDDFNGPQFYTQYLLRFGLTDDVEFRILGQGITWFYTDPELTGFSPINLDMKVHFWDQDPDYYLPAVSLEASLSTDWGTKELSSGYLPFLSFNFDYLISDTTNLEWTVSYAEVETVVNSTVAQKGQVSFQWAVEKDLSDDFQLFIHGQTATHVIGQPGGTQLGIGGFLRCSDRLMLFSLINWGVTGDAPRISAQSGFGIALGRPHRR